MITIPLFKFQHLINKFYRYILANESISYSKPHQLLSIFSVLDNLKNQPLNQVNMGDRVLVNFVDTNEKRLLTLVNADKTQDDENNISVLSPLGSALLGRSKDEYFSVNVFNRNIKCKVDYILNK